MGVRGVGEGKHRKTLSFYSRPRLQEKLVQESKQKQIYMRLPRKVTVTKHNVSNVSKEDKIG